MNTRIVELIIGAMLLGLAVILVVVVMKQRSAGTRQGSEKLTAEQVVDLEVQADAQNGR